MTVQEIYSKLAEHQIKGLMLHEELANYYDFLGLKGYKRCHEYHYLMESWDYRKLNRYFINHHNMLINHQPTHSTKIIPDSWYRATRADVDGNTKRNAIKMGTESWINWERETKKLYEEMYSELVNINEIASAMFIKNYICDVDCELKVAERYMLDRMSVDYDLAVIIPEQCWMHDKYKKMIDNLGKMYESE